MKTRHGRKLRHPVLLPQVISGCEGGEVNVWDITTGAKVLRFKECHGSEEITTMSMDALGKRLITASRAGDVKVCVTLRCTFYMQWSDKKSKS